jgi:glycosyltransferase involved in cell wall biosynthesis
MNTTLDRVVVGDGPYLSELKEKYPHVTFTGVMHGKELAEYYRNASCFVFPSKTDTFGVVMIESMACGTPVAAYPVTGPLDVIDQGVTGSMRDSLDDAVQDALMLDRKSVWSSSKKWTWENCAKQFLSYLTQK